MSARDRDWFAGRSAIVTGGGSGIGAALTRALVEAGADVVCADIDGPAADRVSSSCAGRGRARPATLDVTDAVAVQAVVDEVVERTGRIDLMFNNAGIVIGGETQLLSLEQWDRIIDINIRGVVHGVHAVYPHMVRAGRGTIVNTASAAGLMPSGLLTSYCATKHAVVGLSLSLRGEASGRGVGVTVVCPSAVETPILDKGDHGAFRGREFFLGAERLQRAYDADRLARQVLEAVVRDRAVLVVPGRTRAAWVAARVAPGAVHAAMTRMVDRHRVVLASRVKDTSF